jgi:tetratricopeptide (TPR) repeat protein
MRLRWLWRATPAVLIGIISVAGCARPKPPASSPAPNLQPRLDAANALVRAGCFDCLTGALAEYDALRTFAGAPAAMVEAATIGAIRAALLLELRERELGTTNDQYLAKARGYMAGRDDLSTVFASAFDVIDLVSWRVTDEREVAKVAQVAAVRRLEEKRDTWKELYRSKAGEDELWGYIWLSFACAAGETRNLSPDELVAPLAANRDAPLMSYKAAACPGTRGVPPRQSSVDVGKLGALQKSEPRFAEIDYYVAVHAMLSGKLEEADELLRRAFRWHQKWPAVTLVLAGLAMTAEDFELALGYYDATLELVPGYPSAMLGRVKTLSFTGKNEDAIQMVDRILEGRWNRGEAYYWRAWNNMQLTRNDQAWIDVEAAWKLYINSDVAKLAGMIAYRREQLDVARAKFEEGHRMNENDCELGFYLGLVNAEQRRWPPTAEVFVSTASCLQNAQKRMTEEIVQIQQSNASAARKARQIARREKLIRDSERMLATSWYNTAVAYFNLSRKAEARQYAEKLSSDEQFGERAREILTRLDK